MQRHDPNDASDDLALAKSFGLKGFTEVSSKPAPTPDTPAPTQPAATSPADGSADIALAKRVGLQGFA